VDEKNWLLTEDLHFNFFSNYETMIDCHCACAHAPIERKEEKRLSYSGESTDDESSINLMRKKERKRERKTNEYTKCSRQRM